MNTEFIRTKLNVEKMINEKTQREFLLLFCCKIYAV